MTLRSENWRAKMAPKEQEAPCGDRKLSQGGRQEVLTFHESQDGALREAVKKKEKMRKLSE